MTKKKIGIIAGVLIAAAAIGVGVWYYQTNGGGSNSDKVYVQSVADVMGSGLGIGNRYSGIVQPQQTVKVNADSDMTVGEVLVAIGDTVDVGTPLFNYDIDEINMDLEQKKLELEEINTDISQTNAEIAELTKERDAASEDGKFEYTTEIQTKQAEIKQKEYDRKSKQLEIDKTQKSIDNAQVVSTVQGIVKTINNSSDGESSYGGGDDSGAFMTIMQTGNYRIRGKVNEQNIGLITVGANVIIRSRVDETQTWIGSIDTIDTENTETEDSDNYYDSGNTDTSSTNYPFYVSLENTDGLMIGQHVLVELDNGQEEEKEGLWLLESYIIKEEENSYVWAANDNNRLEKVVVELGEYDEAMGEYEITSGLAEDTMIAFPMDGFYEGILCVTDEAEIDYSSDLYMGDTEGMYDIYDTEGFEEDLYEDDTYVDSEAMMMEEQMMMEGENSDFSENDSTGYEEDAEVSE